MSGFNLQFCQKLMRIDRNMENFVMKNLIPKFLLVGNKEIAANLIKDMVDDPIFEVNRLMYSALIANDVSDLPENYNKLSVQKVSHYLGSICPLHLAALNPNLEILKRLLNMVAGNINAKY